MEIHRVSVAGASGYLGNFLDWSTTPLSLREGILMRKECPIHYWIGGNERSTHPLIAM